MKTVRKLGSTLRLVGALCLGAAAFAAPVVASVSLVGCADEADAQTWVNRLDDPAKRPAAIKRLSQFFEDTWTKANKDRSNPELVALLNKIVEPLAKQYTGAQLDEKTRKELIKLLADMRDTRAAPALTKALSEYEAGKNDEDVKYAAQAVGGLAEMGKLTDQPLIDALWTCFAKFQVSKAKSINLVKDLHDAVLAVKHLSYGPKAVEKLSAPVDPKNPESMMDQTQFWQKTAIQVIGEIKFTGAVKPLVKVLLTPDKAELRATAQTALMKMPKESEAALVAALKGEDPDAQLLAPLWGESKAHVAVLGDTVSWIGRPAGRDAVLAALAAADNDTNRTVLAQSLIRYHADAKLIDAYKAAYGKLSPGARIELLGGLFGRAALAQASSHFYDAQLVDWILKESATLKAEEGEALHVMGLEAAVKLMLPAHKKAVGEAVAKYWSTKEQEIFKVSAEPIDKCAQDVGCYLKLLDAPVPSTPPTASMGPIKAAWMCAVLGNDATRKELLARVDRTKHGGVRQTIVEVIDYLTPKGDNDAAAVLEKVVAADQAAGNKNLLLADDALVKVALRLRARALP